MGRQTTKETPMNAIILFLATLFNVAKAPMLEGRVYTGGLEAEAIYVPAGWEGPVVALPLDETVF
jgi:hypothetical protein